MVKLDNLIKHLLVVEGENDSQRVRDMGDVNFSVFEPALIVFHANILNFAF